MRRKPYRTYNLCIALHRIIAREHADLRSEVIESRERKSKKVFLSDFYFLFSENGSGAYPHGPTWGGAAGPHIDFTTAKSMSDIGRKLLQSVGFKDPDDVSISAAIEANDGFIAQLMQIRDRAQTLTLEHEDS